MKIKGMCFSGHTECAIQFFQEGSPGERTSGGSVKLREEMQNEISCSRQALAGSPHEFLDIDAPEFQGGGLLLRSLDPERGLKATE